MTAITELVLAQLERGEPVAVRSGATDWSAHELRDWSAGIAGFLTDRGIGRGDYVPVLGARSGALVAAWLGVLRSGAAFAPLSLDTPRHRLRHIVDELGCGVLLADQAGRAMLDGFDLSVPVLDDLRRPAGPPPSPPDSAPDDPAVVIYTSGTTGRPKGVLVPHRGLLNTALWWAADTDLDRTDRVLCTWSTAFDGATFEVFRTLVGGAVLVFADDVERRDPRALTRMLRGPRGATVTSMTPSLARAMLDNDQGGPTTLRILYVGGEAVTRQLARDCARVWGAEVRNIYGPTEASCISTHAPVDPAEQRPPIGVPLPNTRAYVLGRNGEELPREVVGELYVAGAGVALGYLGQPELTAAAFRPDPYSDDPTAQMYATGDRAVLREDGLIQCLGRVDDQVKILGHRVEPDEVRRLIEEQPAVRAAAVLAEGDPCRLVAFVELHHPDQPPTRDELLRPLQRWLPPAVLPNEVFVVAAIPMTVNDKADLASLATMRSLPLPRAARVHAPLSPDEQRAAQLFEQALGPAVDHERRVALSGDADFFLLGGHSLLAVRMLAEGERQHGRQLPLGAFLAEPTVAGLGRLLTAALPRPQPAAPDGEDGEYQATAVQQRFWFLDRIRQLRTAYLVPTVLEFTGEVEPGRVAAAVGAVLARHPSLRSRFRLDARARAVYYRTDGAPPPVALTDARDWTADRLATRVAQLCWTPFDLAVDAPARADLLDAGDRLVLVLVAHHIVIDGWGLNELLGQLASRYRDGAAAVLPVPVHPGRLAPTPAPAPEHLLAALRGAPTDVALPHDRPRTPTPSALAGTRSLRLDADLTGRLRATCAELGVTTFMTTAAILATTLARRCDQRDFLFAFPWLGRDGQHSVHAVAMFVDTLILRVDLRGEPNWRELLAQVRTSAMTSFRGAGVPFDMVVAALHPDRDLSRPPLTPVYLSTLDEPVSLPDFGTGLAVNQRDLPDLRLKYELEIVATDRPDALELTATFAIDLFDPPTIDQLLTEFRAATVDLVTDPDTAVMKESTP